MPADKTQAILGDINMALTTVSTGLPILLAAYSSLRAIWQATHPGATEIDYVAYLQQVADEGHAFDATWLTSHGYVQQPDGDWKKI